MQRLVPLLLAVPLGACSTPEAPTELSDLSRFMIREFHSEDSATLRAGATNFAALLDAADYSGDARERSRLPEPLTPEDVVGLERPEGTVLEDTTDVALFFASRHPVAAHTEFTGSEDQLPAEPSAVGYEREFLEGADCFPAGECGLMRTVNTVTRENFLFSMEFVLRKEFRTLETEDGRAAMVSRAWTEEEFAASVGTARLRQSWTLDMWVDHEEGARRIRVNWAETTFDPPIDEDIIVGTTRTGMQDALEAADEALGP